MTVVLDPFVSAQFLGIIGSTLNGEAVLKGRSIFAGRVGEDVAATNLTLIDDPTNPLAYTASEIDGEGLATRRNVLIDGGVLQKFVQSSYSARRSGAAPTGNATRGGFKTTPGCGCLALSLVPGTRSQAELVADVDEGVLIQMVQGLHSGVNPVSGDFSTGASGLMIRGGQLAEPVREFTIASTLQRMLKDVVEVGGDIEWLPMSAAGVSLVIRDVTMSGALSVAIRRRAPAPAADASATRTWPSRWRRAGSGSTSTPTPCGRATRPRPPRSSRRRSSPAGSTCSASPTTTRSRERRSWPGGCRAGWSSGRSCGRTRARSSGCS